MIVESQRGLTVSMAGVPVVRGSWFQYYEPGWSKGYYSSNWSPQEVTRTANGYQMRFKGPDGRAEGDFTFALQGKQITVDFEFRWKGTSPVNVELCAGMLWAPALAAGKLLIDGQAARELKTPASVKDEISARSYGLGKDIRWAGPLGNLGVGGGESWQLFDARNYNQDWARNRELFWLGIEEVQVTPLIPKRLRLTLDLAAKPPTRGMTVPVMRVSTVPVEIGPGEPYSLLPRPKRFEAGEYVVLAKPWLTNRPAQTKILRDELARRWQPFREVKSAIPLVTLERDSKLAAEAFRIETTEKGVTVWAAGEPGWNHAVRLLPRLTKPQSGGLALPSGTLEDEPSIAWRGAHLFVGPRANEFQRRLWDNVLLPMRFNHVVLQCERTAWKAIPGTATAITMPRSALADLFAWYRQNGVEPIPMIQSFGHMEWLFANGKNSDAAFNPNVLYSVDPRKPATTRLLNSIWDEAVELLKPSALHFGLDEINMRGWPDEPGLVTDLWTKQMGFLASISKRHGLPMMLWGDMALDKSEAPDAQNGDSPAHAAARRAAIPKGSFITDWHYKADARPNTFAGVLELWEREGMKPIASGWNRPENILGFAAAAAQTGAGYLQTTWAGYESFEGSLFNNLDQYVAFVRAGEAAWNGGGAALLEAGEVFCELMYGEPKSVGARPGVKLSASKAVNLGSVLTGDEVGEIQLLLTRPERASRIRMEVATGVAGEEGEPVAEIIMGGQRKMLRYGHHVRAASDPRPCLYTRKGWLEFKLDNPQLTRIQFTATSRHLGFRADQILLMK